MFRFTTKEGFVKTGNDTCKSHTGTIFELNFFGIGITKNRGEQTTTHSLIRSIKFRSEVFTPAV